MGKRTRLISQMEMAAVIQSRVFDAGSQKALAIEKRISPSYLSDVLCMRREISQQLAEKFGYRKVVFYERY